LIANVFTFVDASQMILRVDLWDERDKAIKAGEETLNNRNIEKFTVDKDASYGNKGKNEFWYDYKRHVAVCVKNGLISKAAATTAKVSDDKGLKHICPKGGMVIGDKSYCLKEAQRAMKINGCHSLTNRLFDSYRRLFPPPYFHCFHLSYTVRFIIDTSQFVRKSVDTSRNYGD
jgi:transposase, IS5 family